MSWAGWGRCPYILASLHTTSDGGDDGGPAGAEWAHCRRRVHSLVVRTDGRCSVSTAHLHLVQYEALLCSQCMMVGGQRVHRLMVRENHCAHTAVWPPPVRLPPHNILILISWCPILHLCSHSRLILSVWPVLPFILIPDFDSMITYKIYVCAITSLSLLSHLNAIFIYRCYFLIVVDSFLVLQMVFLCFIFFIMRIKVWQAWKKEQLIQSFFNGLRFLSPFSLVQTSGYPSCDNLRQEILQAWDAET